MLHTVSRAALCAALPPLCLCLVSEALAQATEPMPPTEAAPLVLPPTVVEADAITQTSAGPVQGYRALTAGSATRTETPIEQIPQSIQVIDRKVIDDQDAQTISDAVRNVSGVRGIDPLEINNASFIVRGFQAETYVDGFQLFSTQTELESLVNVERIEVVKGPTATLFGGATGAPVGGLINVVSKSPTAAASGEVGIRGGSFDTVGGNDFSIRRQRFIGADNTPNIEARNGSVQAKLEHRFDGVFKASVDARHLNSTFHQYSVWATGTADAEPFPGTTIFPLTTGELPQDIEPVTVSPNVVASFAERRPAAGPSK